MHVNFALRSEIVAVIIYSYVLPTVFVILGFSVFFSLFHQSLDFFYSG